MNCPTTGAITQDSRRPGLTSYHQEENYRTPRGPWKPREDYGHYRGGPRGSNHGRSNYSNRGTNNQGNYQYGYQYYGKRNQRSRGRTEYRYENQCDHGYQTRSPPPAHNRRTSH